MNSIPKQANRTTKDPKPRERPSNQSERESTNFFKNTHIYEIKKINIKGYINNKQN